ncbi:hypothetical protein [Pseudofrankia inefficax]|uniref:Uncharacterized protein n=1 Tax=Pseudofrankia inefficax (strain DSM 45817 / CECT 9037 / DDB 130130 / EuI1c) TaxID=298654 RepID=E3JB48_PSEI1|nr:hypothetical protein [Pseudofrankia inefficax]ADP84669.1 hypothetical protein FraEuI1c_6699 [Pseudofrankia inefficax]
MGQRPAVRVPTAPFEVVLAAGFVGFLILCAGFSSMPGVRHDGLLLLCALVAVLGWWASPAAAVAVGTLAWPFYLGWVVRDDGQLGLRGWIDPLVLAVFVGIALLAVTLRKALTWSVRSRFTETSAAEACAGGTGDAVGTGDTVGAGDAVGAGEVAAAGVAALFQRLPRRSPRAAKGAPGRYGTRPAGKINQV